MEARDIELIEATMATKFAGYARPRIRLVSPDLDRIVTCIALLTTMVLSGIFLGTSQRYT